VRLPGRAAATALAVAVLSVCPALEGCDRRPEALRGGPGTVGPRAGAVKNAVAVVDGEGIALSEVEELGRRSGLSAREALSRLEAERLLMKEAARRGFGGDPEVRLVARRAAVQALVIAEADKLGVSEDELREAYAGAQARFNKPEMREAVHLLARMPLDASPGLSRAGEQFAREAIQQGGFTGAEDVEEVLKRFRQRNSRRFAVVVERLAPVSRSGRLAKQFEDALFEPSRPGMVPHPVRTSYGWHAIYVTSIEPEEHVGFEEAADLLRPEILLEKRTKAMEAFLGQLERNADIQRDESAIEWLLKAKLALFGKL
jgi:parvulin-like peptidyl-prolyl isomerase